VPSGDVIAFEIDEVIAHEEDRDADASQLLLKIREKRLATKGIRPHLDILDEESDQFLEIP
jgi:hypothetical protein